MNGHGGGMLIRPATSNTLTQCWYTRIHLPVAQRSREEDGALHSICRHCLRPIRSHGGKSWRLADGVDLDELAARSTIRYICVTSVADGMVIARYPVDGSADDDAIATRLEEVIATHDAKAVGSGLDVRVMGGPRG